MFSGGGGGPQAVILIAEHVLTGSDGWMLVVFCLNGFFFLVLMLLSWMK